MTTCLAICRNRLGDLKGCRNYAAILKDDGGNEYRSITCGIHKDYFKNENEALRNSTSHLHYHLEGIRDRVEECISLGLIGPKKEFISNLTDNHRVYPRFAYYILLCAKYGKIQPSWNRKFWKKITAKLWEWHGSYVIGPVLINWQSMQSMLCVRGDIEVFYSGLLAFPITRWEHVSDDKGWLYFLEECSNTYPVWFMEFWMTDASKHTEILNELRKDAHMRDHPLIKFLGGEIFAKWLLRKKETFYLLQRILYSLKNQIMAVASHPGRHCDWVLTNEEKQGIEERWGLCKRERLGTVLEEVCGVGLTGADV
jgi:hypothetical protein